MIARRAYSMTLAPHARADLQEILETAPACLDSINEALKSLLRTHPREGEPKGGRLEGARSWDFDGEGSGEKASGRIVYRLKDYEIVIFAIHPDHDEAYRRARSRKTYLP